MSVHTVQYHSSCVRCWSSHAPHCPRLSIIAVRRVVEEMGWQIADGPGAADLVWSDMSCGPERLLRLRPGQVGTGLFGMSMWGFGLDAIDATPALMFLRAGPAMRFSLRRCRQVSRCERGFAPCVELVGPGGVGLLDLHERPSRASLPGSISQTRTLGLPPSPCPSQRVNHFPGILELARKKSLARNLARLRCLHPTHYAFHPRAWMLPEQGDALVAELRACASRGRTRTFAIKPDAGCQGRGIRLVQGVGDVEAAGYGPAARGATYPAQGPPRPAVASLYVDRPLLLHGRKFDLRLYVLIRGVQPLDALLYSEVRRGPPARSWVEGKRDAKGGKPWPHP